MNPADSKYSLIYVLQRLGELSRRHPLAINMVYWMGYYSYTYAGDSKVGADTQSGGGSCAWTLRAGHFTATGYTFVLLLRQAEAVLAQFSTSFAAQSSPFLPLIFSLGGAALAVALHAHTHTLIFGMLFFWLQLLFDLTGSAAVVFNVEYVHGLMSTVSSDCPAPSLAR